MTKSNDVFAFQDEDKPGIIEELKTQIVENVEIYATKYDEEFQPYVGDFVSTVWTLLVGLDLRMVNDVLISVSMKFLSCVVERPNHKPLFEDPNTLRSICEKVSICFFSLCDLYQYDTVGRGTEYAFPRL